MLHQRPLVRLPMPTELLQMLALDPELMMLMALPLQKNMALLLTPAPALAQERLPLRPQENTVLPQQRNTEPLPMLVQDLARLLKLQESMAPLPMIHMVLLLRPLALALARSPLTPMLPLLPMRTPGGVVARARESGLPGVAKLSAEVAPRRTSLPRRARAAARLPGRAASSRGSQSSRGGQPRQERGSSRGADVDSSPSPFPTGAHTGTPLPSVMLDVASRLRLNQSPFPNSQVLSLQVIFTNSCLLKP